jgi:hypothetical protein
MSSYTPGRTGIAILRTVAGGSGFVCSTPGQYQSALKLADRGLLDRDPGRGMSRRFIGNEAGTLFIQTHDDALARKAGQK